MRTVVIPVLAAGATVAIWSLLFSHRAAASEASSRLRRLPRNAASPAQHMPAGLEPRQNASALDADRPGLPGDVALPLTFWDAPPPSVELDEDEIPASLPPAGYDEAYDSMSVEDLSTHWLARATQTPDGPSFEDADDVDDPAEIAADSMSMVSEASRAAASLDLAEAAEAFDDDGEDRRF